MSKNLWSREELLLTLNLYYKISFSKINYRHPEIIKLSKLIERTPSAVALKLVNFARLDPTLQSRNISGMKHGAKADEEIWNEYYGKLDKLAFESERILADYKNQSIEISSGINIENIPEEGKERERVIKTRVNQQFFRSAILASYENKCCITGLNIPELLIASHIKPWSKDKRNRMNLSNGLCLNPLHDKAFDSGLITITSAYKVLLSKRIHQIANSRAKDFLISFADKKITLPYKYLPDIKFLEYHNHVIFRD